MKFIPGRRLSVDMRNRAVLLSVLLAASLAGGVVAPAAGQQSETHAGTHVQFETTDRAVSNYAVDGDVIVQNVTVQSASEAGGGGSGIGLGTATDFRASGLAVATRSGGSVTLSVDSGAEMQSHDNGHGILQVRATGEDQVVGVELANGSQTESASDRRVVVTKENGSQGTFIVVGEGEVAVDDNGDVAAQVADGSQLVYRQYDEGKRDENDEEAERMIENGTATAEVYVQAGGDAGENAADDGRETAVDTVEYGQDTTVTVGERSRDTVEMTVERTESEGKVVLATVSEEAFNNPGDIQVLVDGEAAAQADAYSAVEQAAQQGDQPRYHVAQSSSAQAATDVAIGIDHFSERNVVLTSADEDQGTTEGGDDGATDGATDGDGAGFGVLAALAALAAALVAQRRR
jgi:PGF-CTERM protein